MGFQMRRAAASTGGFAPDAPALEVAESSAEQEKDA
jgi:hypothetical protein